MPLELAIPALVVAFFLGLWLGCVAMADHLRGDDGGDDSNGDDW